MVDVGIWPLLTSMEIVTLFNAKGVERQNKLRALTLLILGTLTSCFPGTLSVLVCVAASSFLLGYFIIWTDLPVF